MLTKPRDAALVSHYAPVLLALVLLLSSASQSASSMAHANSVTSTTSQLGGAQFSSRLEHPSILGPPLVISSLPLAQLSLSRSLSLASLPLASVVPSQRQLLLMLLLSLLSLLLCVLWVCHLGLWGSVIR